MTEATHLPVYGASHIKRRATKLEMEARAAFLIDYAMQHQPVTVRQLFYAATVAGVPGIEKTEGGYNKVQRQVLKLRRENRLPYGCIADGTRWAISPRTYDGWEAALERTALVYRKALWAGQPVSVEVWLEKDALAGTVRPVTDEHDVPLMVTRGFTSETFAYNAVEDAAESGRQFLVILALYDFDRSGQDAQASLREKVERFGREFGVTVEFYSLALSADQVIDMNLPTRPAKRKSAADRRWQYDFAAELDAIPPDQLRAMVRHGIEQWLPSWELERLKKIEAEERATLNGFLEKMR